jgi:hypothetical protein
MGVGGNDTEFIRVSGTGRTGDPFPVLVGRASNVETGAHWSFRRVPDGDGLIRGGACGGGLKSVSSMDD